MQVYASTGAPPQATEILSSPPRSGSFSVYSQKLTALAFSWLCAIVVWGNVANYAGVIDKCSKRCDVQIAFGVLAWIYTSILLMFNYLTEKEFLSRTGFFSHGAEIQWIAFLVILWVPVVVSTSTVGSLNLSADDITPFLAIWFAWGGLFGAMYATYKAYHSFKEEDLPSAPPDGYNEADYVYG